MKEWKNTRRGETNKERGRVGGGEKWKRESNERGMRCKREMGRGEIMGD